MKEFFTSHDVAELLGVTTVTVARWIDRGLLEAFRTGGGHRRVEASELRRFMLSRGLSMPAAAQKLPARLRLLLLDENAARLQRSAKEFAPVSSAVEVRATRSALEGL